MINSTVVTQSPYVMYFVVTQTDLNIHDSPVISVTTIFHVTIVKYVAKVHKKVTIK